MVSSIIDEINKKISSFSFFEFSIKSYQNGVLILVGSEDFSYYYNIEIHFHDVFTMISNLDWRVNTQGKAIDILDGPEAFELNKKYRVEAGNTIFVLFDEDLIQYYVIAKSINATYKVTPY